MDFKRENKMCSFCGTQGSPDVPLVGGLGAMICASCVASYHATLATPETIAAASRPPWLEMTDTDLVDTLPLILRSAEQNAAFAQEWVEMMRERRITWAEIGKALGVSRQAVWDRFAHKAARRSDSA